MAVVLKKSMFIHIPKTGGTWIIAATKRAGLFKYKTKHKHPSLVEFRCINPKFDLKQIKFFTFVRNPVTWWQSRWSDPFMRRQYLNNEQPEKMPWIGNIRWLNYESQIQTQEQFEDFNTYIKWMLDRRPGFGGDYFRFMTNVSKLEVGKYEQITQDLVEILYRCGEEFKKSDILETPKANESDPELKIRRLYKEENLRRLIEAEKRMMEQYGYSTKLEDYSDLVR